MFRDSPLSIIIYLEESFVVFCYACNCVTEHNVDSLSVNCEHSGQVTKEKGINLIKHYRVYLENIGFVTVII